MKVRRIALAAALLAATSPGCFVMEELEQGEKLMENPGFSAPEPSQKSDAQTSPEARGSGASADEESAAWWRSSRSLDTDALDAEFVRCNLGGTTSFMLEPDCRARGGRPAPAR